ncbi:hypothetical protein [Tianweitania sp.]|uniref:hypothetical protein n=1 Tax=Tianweitania sp. TaxID=2021634 RepID=UPI00289E2BD6|nr:hypothetical protein [Tianweitania sp.]
MAWITARPAFTRSKTRRERIACVKHLARALALTALVMMAAPGCSESQPAKVAEVQTDIALLAKFITLHPAPVEAKWSVTPIGTEGGLGPTDNELWAVLRYSEADLAAISHALKTDASLPPITLDAPPAWLLAEVDLSRFKHGADYVFEGPVSPGAPFASNLYTIGFALMLPDERVLIRFGST